MKPVSETAFYCCGARMLDAQSAKPIANDYLAHRFMTTEGTAVFRRFSREKIANAACVVRHKIIDNTIATFLSLHPQGKIILLGAGFDTRAYRFNGGEWFELDEYQLVDFKNQQLPASECPNPLQRYTVDFSTEELDQRLAGIEKTGPVLMVIEGVFMYLDTLQISHLLATLRKHFPQHELVCDLMTKRFQQLFGHSIQRKIKAMGNRFVTITSPELLFAQNGYHQASCTSIVATTLEWRVLPVPQFIGKGLPRLIENGYSIYHFTYTGSQGTSGKLTCLF